MYLTEEQKVARKVQREIKKLGLNLTEEQVQADLENMHADGLFDKLGINVGKCPNCGNVRVLDALSRDNVRSICGECGTAEALNEFFGSVE